MQTVSVSSGSTTIVETLLYSNPATQYLTETNSEGVITGMPAGATVGTGMPTVVTSQPAVATIPAGEPTGYNTLTYNGTAGVTSFTISVGTKTTMVLGGTQAGTTSGSVFIPAGQGTKTGGGHHATGTNGGGQGTQTGSAAASSSTGAAANMKVASAGVFGLGALIAALL